MKEAISYLCPIIMPEHARAADAQGIRQNRNRDRRSDDDNRAPETVALDPLQKAARFIIITARARHVGEDDRERQESHQRADAATGFDDFELLGLTRALRHQLDDVSLSEDRNIKEAHHPDGAARGEEL